MQLFETEAENIKIVNRKTITRVKAFSLYLMKFLYKQSKEVHAYFNKEINYV